MHNMKGLEYSESVERAQHILKKKKTNTFEAFATCKQPEPI